MQQCAAEDKLDMASASVSVLALLCEGVCPAAGQHPFFYEGRIPQSREGSGRSIVYMGILVFRLQRSQGPAY